MCFLLHYPLRTTKTWWTQLIIAFVVSQFLIKIWDSLGSLLKRLKVQIKFWKCNQSCNLCPKTVCYLNLNHSKLWIKVLPFVQLFTDSLSWANLNGNARVPVLKCVPGYFHSPVLLLYYSHDNVECLVFHLHFLFIQLCQPGVNFHKAYLSSTILYIMNKRMCSRHWWTWSLP